MLQLSKRQFFALIFFFYKEKSQWDAYNSRSRRHRNGGFVLENTDKDDDCYHVGEGGESKEIEKGTIKELWRGQQEGHERQEEKTQSIMEINLSFINIPKGKYHHIIDNETMAPTTGQEKRK